MPASPPTAASDAPAGPTSVFAPPLRPVMLAIMSTVALSAFEGLAVAAALPQVAADLGSVSLLPWVLTTFLLVAGVATVVSGALVDRFGVGPVFRVSVTIFALGGALAGLAPNMATLIVARGVHGIGAGATTAAALSAAGLVFPPRLVGRAFAAMATVWGVMSVAGPGIAAGLLLVASWRWIFLINLPIGAVALWLGSRHLPMEPPEGNGVRSRVEPLSLLLLATFSIGSLVAVDRLNRWSLVALAVALLAGWAVMRRSEGRPDALVAPRHVLRAPFGPLGWTIALLLVGGIGTQLYVPLYVTAGRGVSASLAAWSVMFFTLGWTTGAQASSRMMDRSSPLRVTTVGVSVVAPACAAVGVTAGLGTSLWLVFAALVAGGFGMGAATNSALTLLRQLAVDEEVGRAVAAHQYIRSQGFAGGSALGGAVLLLVVGGATGDVEVVRSLLERSGDVAVDAGVADAVARGFAAAAVACATVAAAAHLPLAHLRRHLRRLDAQDA